MKLCFIAEATSIHAQRWVQYFVERGHAVSMITRSRPHDSIPNVTMYGLDGSIVSPETSPARPTTSHSRRWMNNLVIQSGFTTALKRASLEARLIRETQRYRASVHACIERIEPDLIHALRIPNEGFFGAFANRHPLVVSSWGSDFTFFAQSPIFRRWTQATMKQTDLLIADCRRDERIALEFGYAGQKSRLVLPGSSVDTHIFQPGNEAAELRNRWQIPADAPVIFSPRGFGIFYNADMIVRAMPRVLAHHPNAILVMAGDERDMTFPHLQNLSKNLGTEHFVRFVGRIPHEQMPAYYHLSTALVSATLSDGVPISLLEAMATGVIPVVSGLESIREWVTDQVNGYLVNPASLSEIGSALSRALEANEKNAQIRATNLDLVRRQGDYYTNMRIAESAYEDTLKVSKNF